ncbi:hypothetical protein [Aureimonas phyllosphaerae]|uniref:Uncharacterized protein n=1 Tax=Aureimonas phyllosphaerae TaxID=1166078 RepID=A0A7W6FWJ3_9HYPH|nr:hypothetical protein [Aureimonas phyllosphaerae]MBB3938283.1 hypothetical protein [Aureimonas phyllosphaerae]MBB3962290.1 hypothetical protein [Aureimonas phyllosphaerae]SFF57643.1 hypothetical protein SAMN05216566_1344 [Aureimonas phyllosphaerae]
MVSHTTPLVIGNSQRHEDVSSPEELQPAVGLFVGLALSAILWITLLIAWLVL